MLRQINMYHFGKFAGGSHILVIYLTELRNCNLTITLYLQVITVPEMCRMENNDNTV